MEKRIIGFFVILALVAFMITLNAQTVYTSQTELYRKFTELAEKNPGICSVSTIGKTLSGSDIKVITVGTGDKNKKPGVAVVAGIEAGYRLGREVALGLAAHLVNQASGNEISGLLENVTFYIIPDASPESAADYSSPLVEKSINSRSVDEDRDFVFDEDPAEDLDKDGFITFLRISDPTGSMLPSAEDPRVMVPADLSKGEKGKYRIITEGIDNDGDGLFNEDGKGGVNFNRNFTFNYEEYGMNAGIHAVSEPESKAIADFLYDHFNIYAVISFGPQDNLGQPMRSSERQGAQQESSGQVMPGQMQFTGRIQGDRRISSIMKSDETINKLVSEKYHEITGLKGAPVSKPAPGNFMEWAYFHYGRYSFSTPGWWFPSDKAKNPEVALLKFSAENKLPIPFKDWKEITHPDFPGKKVESGGFKPFASITPPDTAVEAIVKKNVKFITEVASMHPAVKLTDIKTENLGDGISRLSLKVFNSGIFATCAEVGDFNQWTRIMRISLELSNGQSVLSGQKVQRIRRLEGGQSAEFSWVISGKGIVKITAGAVNSGLAEASTDLK